MQGSRTNEDMRQTTCKPISPNFLLSLMEYSYVFNFGVHFLHLREPDPSSKKSSSRTGTPFKKINSKVHGGNERPNVLK